MTINQNLAKGVCLVAIALFFGIQARTYPFGTFSAPGAGMYATSVSGILLLIGCAIGLRTWFTESTPLAIQPRNILLVTASLVCFAAISEYVNMLVALAVMVLMASYASDDFSIARTIKISLSLAAIALAMKFGLGFQLPLY